MICVLSVVNCVRVMYATQTGWLGCKQITRRTGNEGKHNVSGSAGLELNSQRYDGFNITRRGIS